MEIEAKFYLTDPDELRRRLTQLEAELTRAPRLERNWRFDDADGRLSRDGLVLRLRVDEAAHLTFKSPSDVAEVRGEIEFTVSDPQAAEAFLRALGYHPVWAYEKRRTVYRLGPAQVMLDELPFGFFVEIEASSLEAVVDAAGALGLEWAHRLPASYFTLFGRLRLSRRLAFQDATFDNFKEQHPVQPEEFGAIDGLTAIFDPRAVRTRKPNE